MKAAADRLTAEKLMGLAERHRRKAEIHEVLGEIDRAAECRALAKFQEERARRLLRKGTAA